MVTEIFVVNELLRDKNKNKNKNKNSGYSDAEILELLQDEKKWHDEVEKIEEKYHLVGIHYISDKIEDFF
jgi:hypothetical protein